METKDLLTVVQAAEKAQLSADAIWKEIREGRLRTVDLGFQHQMLIAPGDFVEWQSQRKRPGLTVEDVADLCGVTQQAVRNWVSRGHLASHKVLGRLVFERSAVVAFAKSRGMDVSELESHAA